jgi:hypothetical protein
MSQIGSFIVSMNRSRVNIFDSKIVNKSVRLAKLMI